MSKAPAGVSGKQRALFLSLTEEQKETYLYHFNTIGRPAALAYRYTVELVAV